MSKEFMQARQDLIKLQEHMNDGHGVVRNFPDENTTDPEHMDDGDRRRWAQRYTVVLSKQPETDEDREQVDEAIMLRQTMCDRDDCPGIEALIELRADAWQRQEDLTPPRIEPREEKPLEIAVDPLSIPVNLKGIGN